MTRKNIHHKAIFRERTKKDVAIRRFCVGEIGADDRSKDRTENKKKKSRRSPSGLLAVLRIVQVEKGEGVGGRAKRRRVIIK